jgi:protein transport protein SEC13
LASCGFDRKIIIWKEGNQHKWEKIYEYNEHKNSVNCISFANHEFGLILVAGSSDGHISLHEYKSNKYLLHKFILIYFNLNI